MYRLYIDSLYYYIINLIILLAVDFMPWLLAAIQLTEHYNFWNTTSSFT